MAPHTRLQAPPAEPKQKRLTPLFLRTPTESLRQRGIRLAGEHRAALNFLSGESETLRLHDRRLDL